MEKIDVRKTTAVALLVLAVGIAAAAKEKSVESVWADSPLKIDGLSDDWNSGPFHPEKRSRWNMHSATMPRPFSFF